MNTESITEQEWIPVDDNSIKLSDGTFVTCYNRVSRDTILHVHNAAITAERQRAQAFGEQLDSYVLTVQRLEADLLSALAAIEKHTCTLGEQINVDLSLLHERDAEVRKPLVDALEGLRLRLQSPIAWYKNPATSDEDYWVTKFTHDQLEGNLAACRSRINDALAKVKQ